MKSRLLLLLVLLLPALLHAKDVLVFGAIATVDTAIIEKQFRPLLHYLEQHTGKTMLFQTGYDYQDTINKFADGTFDLGYIGPAPYVLANKSLANKRQSTALRIIAGVENNHTPYFHSVIVTKKNSPVSDLDDLKGKSIAFGSPKSTLSYYVPMQMLIEKGIDKQLSRFDFLGKHDKVAQYVIMGKYDAGALKESVARKYAQYLKVIASSEDIYDFSIVASHTMAQELFQTMQTALYALKNTKILHSIKSTATGFIPRKASDYQNIGRIMKQVEAHRE